MQIMPSFFMLLIIAVAMIGFISVGIVVARKVPWLGVLMATTCLLFFLSLAWLSASYRGHAQVVYTDSIQEQSSMDLLVNAETETAKQTAIRTRIEILEKELIADLERVKNISEQEQEDAIKEENLPKDSELVDDKKKGKIKKQQVQEVKQLLETAKQELQNEKEKLSTGPVWMESQTIIEKKNLTDYLSSRKTAPNRFVISSGRFMTTKEAQGDVNRLANLVIASKLMSQTGQPSVVINESQIRSLISQTYSEELQIKILGGSPTTMHREHLLIDMSPANMTALLPSLREKIIEKRIFVAAGGLLGIMLTSGLLSFVLSRGKE